MFSSYSKQFEIKTVRLSIIPSCPTPNLISNIGFTQDGELVFSLVLLSLWPRLTIYSRYYSAQHKASPTSQPRLFLFHEYVFPNPSRIEPKPRLHQHSLLCVNTIRKKIEVGLSWCNNPNFKLSFDYNRSQCKNLCWEELNSSNCALMPISSLIFLMLAFE